MHQEELRDGRLAHEMIGAAAVQEEWWELWAKQLAVVLMTILTIIAIARVSVLILGGEIEADKEVAEARASTKGKVGSSEGSKAKGEAQASSDGLTDAPGASRPAEKEARRPSISTEGHTTCAELIRRGSLSDKRSPTHLPGPAAKGIQRQLERNVAPPQPGAF